VRAADLALWIARGDMNAASALLSTVTAQTKARVEEDWAEIEIIASALVEKRKLSGEEILSLFARPASA
jgi:hypothetical protein